MRRDGPNIEPPSPVLTVPSNYQPQSSPFASSNTHLQPRNASSAILAADRPISDEPLLDCTGIEYWSDGL